jgi:hypothetical protein
MQTDDRIGARQIRQLLFTSGRVREQKSSMKGNGRSPSNMSFDRESLEWMVVN